ncbi:MAG: hypothetical protein ACTS44_01635 [Candidatus Hodgkinia cicadicola]
MSPPLPSFKLSNVRTTKEWLRNYRTNLRVREREGTKWTERRTSEAKC